MKKIFFLLILGGLFACTTTRKITQTTHEKLTDTVFITQETHDTTIKTIPDSASIIALVKCQDGREALVKMIRSKPGEKIRTEFVRIHDTLKFQASIDSGKIAFTYYNYHIKEFQKKEKTSVTQKTIIKYRIPKWALFLLIGLCAVIFIKFLLPLIKLKL